MNTEFNQLCGGRGFNAIHGRQGPGKEKLQQYFLHFPQSDSTIYVACKRSPLVLSLTHWGEMVVLQLFGS